MIGRIRDHERLSLSLLAFLAVFFLIAFLRPVLGDADSWWHLAAGKWILANQQVPTVDPFSYSRPGAPWHAQEWLSEVVMWATYAHWGWEGLIGLAALLAGGAAAIFCHHVRRFLPPVAAIALTVLVALCLMPSAWVRPHMMVLPILLLWLIRLLAARDQGKAPPLLLAALMVLWANMHASFLLGLVMIVPFALEAVAQPGDRRGAMIGWGSFALVSLTASLVTPFGIEGLIYPLQVAAMETLNSIVEWKPPTLADSPFFFLLLFGLLLAFILLGVRFRPFRALLFLLFLYMAFSHRRHIFVFAFLGSLLAAEPVGRALPKRTAPERGASALDRGFVLAMAASVLMLLAARILVPVGAGLNHGQPLAAIAAVPPELRTKAVFNHYNFGGPLIFSGIRPFIDGRADMYGDAFVKDYLAAEKGEPAIQARLFRDYAIRWTILPPRSPLVPYLAARGWRLIYADDRAVVQASPAFRRTNPTEVRRVAALRQYPVLK